MHPPCPVCASPFTAHVGSVVTRRTKRDIGLFACLDCRSFWNPSGYQEDAAQLARDLEWGLSVKARNEAAAARLFDRLGELGVRPTSVAEIGCGIGTLLSVARKRGMKTIGFDVNAEAIRHAREVNGLDAHVGYWDADTATPSIDLYLNIMVLEHLQEPRPLIQALCSAAKAQSAALFISVPFLEREKWDFILDPSPYTPGTPFFDNDVHVTHFTVEGLKKAMRAFGQENVHFIEAGLWHGVLALPPSE